MKNYEEMARCVLEARDEHNRKKKIRQAKIKRYTPVVFSFCFAVLLGFGVRHHMNEFPRIPMQIDMTETTTEPTTETDMTDTSTKARTEQNTTEKQTAESETAAMTQNHGTEPLTDQSDEKTEEGQQTQPHETEQETDETELIITHPVVTDSIVTEPAITEPETLLPTESSFEQPTTTEIPSTSVPDEDPNTNLNPLHWNEMTINQQYNMAEFGEPLAFYHTAEKEVSADQIGDFICLAYMSGYDFYSDTYYHCDSEAYKIKNDESTMIAVKFDNDDKFYLYKLTVPNQNQELELDG